MFSPFYRLPGLGKFRVAVVYLSHIDSPASVFKPPRQLIFRLTK